MSPSSTASKKRPASRSRSRREASNRGWCSSTCRRARTASWRQLSSLLPTIAGDLVVAVVEDVVQQEHGALDRA